MREWLVDLASRALVAGVVDGCVLAPDRAGWPDALHALRATFVTLRRPCGALRGCRGQLEATRALGDDVFFNAIASALDDPRFAPLAADEIDGLEIEVAVLSPLEAVDVRSEAELRRVLMPGRDGLVLIAGSRRATFLPKVWEMLPDPADFLGELKRKAGLPTNYWSDAVRIDRYRTEDFAGRASIGSAARASSRALEDL
jgi:hypothetical protein